MVFLNHKYVTVNEIGLGGYGVRLFFILSGYLILGILHNHRGEVESGAHSAGRAWGTFLLSRSFRIFPIYYIAVSILSIFSFTHVADSVPPSYLVWFVTYTSNFPIAHLTGQYPPSGGHLWSLSVEEQFYLISAPLVLFLPSRHTKSLCWVILGVGIVAALSGFLTHNSRAVYVGSLSNFGFMGLGGLLALDLKPLKRLYSFSPAAYLLFYTACPFISFLLHRHWPIAGSAIFFVSSMFGMLLIGSIVERQSSISTRILHSAPLQALGRVSYAFYLFHLFIMLETWFPHLVYGWAVVLDFMATWAVAEVSWRCIEHPILNLRRRLLPPEQVVAAPASP
jgi:peptidoglycan/LPS O-acetylase OafA/YrhL